MIKGTIKQPLPCVGRRNTLSICMIVKNEESNIGRALKSFLPFADEIIINDTGSTDRTMDIIKSFPKTKLIQSEWIGDFAYSRNLGLEQATCPWIVWMDADDYVPPNEVKSFLKLKNAPLDRILNFKICNTENGEPSGMFFFQARMFPNNPKIRFRGNVHETMTDSALELGLHTFTSDVKIWHMGYETLEIRQKKARRNLELQLSGGEHTESTNGLIQLGDSYHILGELEKALEYYSRAVEGNYKLVVDDLVKTAYNKKARTLMDLNRIEESRETFQKCLDKFPESEEALYGLAVVKLKENDEPGAMKLFGKMLDMEAEVSIGGTHHEKIQGNVLRNLSLWEYKSGNFAKAKKYAERLIKKHPEFNDAKTILDNANAAILNEQDKRPVLSVCMIVKNEEANIGKCLDSLKGLPDEVIVVDTGSTDKTVEIAQSRGARIEHFEWQKDFATARNHSLSFAKGRWVMWTDADDRYPQQTIEDLRRILATEPPNKVFSLVVCNTKDEGATGLRFSQIRIFPNNPKIRFEGRIHEQVLPSIQKLNLPQKLLSSEVFHTGYEDPEMLKEKQKRNLDLFREQFPNEEGMNPLDMYHYGASYEIIGDKGNALKWFKNSLKDAKLKRYDELCVLLPSEIAHILEETGNLQEALEYLNLSLKENPAFEPSLYRKARILYLLGQKKEAIKFFGYVISLIPKVGFLPTNASRFRSDSLKILADYWNESGQVALAIDVLKYLKRNLEGASHEPLSLAEIYLNHDCAVEAYDILKFLQPELSKKAEFAFLFAQSLVLTEQVEEAKKIVKSAIIENPQNTDLIDLAKAMGMVNE